MNGERLIVFREEPEGGFTVTVPSLPGCVTYGKTLKEARQMADQAIALYLESRNEEKQSLTGE